MQYRKRPVFKNESFIERYPKLFGFCFVTTCMGILFSRPIYDMYTGYKTYVRQKKILKTYQSQQEESKEE